MSLRIVPSFALRLLIASILTGMQTAEAADPQTRYEFSVTSEPPRAYQEFDLTVTDGSILDFGRALRTLRLQRGFPLLYGEYDSLVEDGSEVAIQVDSDQKVNLKLRNAPLGDAIATICNQLDMGVERAAGGWLELDHLSNTFDYWACAGPMLLTFRVNQDRNRRIDITDKAANSADAVPLKIAMYSLPGEASRTMIRLDKVSLISDTNTSHPIRISEGNGSGEWRCNGDLPLPTSRIAGIEGNVVAVVARELLTIRLRPGQQHYADGSRQLKIAVTDLQQSPTLEIDGTKFEPREEGGTMFSFRVEVEWANGVSEREWLPIEQIFTSVAGHALEPNDAKQGQQVLNDKVSYAFIENTNCSPTADAREEYNAFPERFVNWATACQCVPQKSEGRTVLHFFSDDESEIRTCHEIRFARHELLTERFRAKRSAINARRIKIEEAE